jgi:DNA-binding GntR family transcriptional regulator
MSVTWPPGTYIIDQVYETLKHRLVRRELGPGE